MKILFSIFSIVFFNILIQNNIPENGNFIEIDKFGNCYLVNNNSIIKFDESLNKLAVYQEKNLGEISSIDVSNVFNNAVFYKDFSTIIVLDNQLSEIKRINLNDLDFYEPLIICNSTKKGFYIYDNSEKRIFYLDENSDFSKKSLKLNKSISSNIPTYILENKEKIYLNIKNSKVLVFNNLLKLEQIIDIKIENSFQIIGLNIVFYDFISNKIIKYNLDDSKIDSLNIDFKNIKDLKINNSKQFILTNDSLFLKF